MEKQKIYYTVDKEYDIIDEEIYELTGNKTVCVYKIYRNNFVLWFELNLVLGAFTDYEINEYFREINLDPKDYKLIRL